MKVFLDANILVATLNKEYPKFTFTSRILSLADNSQFTLYTSSLCLAIAFYFSAKKSGTQQARNKVSLLASKLKLAVISESAVELAIANSSIHDLEDGFQYYAAKEAGCSCIVTEDLDDFHFSEIEVLGSESFLSKYVFGDL